MAHVYERKSQNREGAKSAVGEGEGGEEEYLTGHVEFLESAMWRDQRDPLVQVRDIFLKVIALGAFLRKKVWLLAPFQVGNLVSLPHYFVAFRDFAIFSLLRLTKLPRRSIERMYWGHRGHRGSGRFSL